MAESLRDQIVSYFRGSWNRFYAEFVDVNKGKRNREGIITLCPFHSDKDPSLSINFETGAWYCHSEKEGGDAFSFYARLNSLGIRHDFSQICSNIGERFGISATETRNTANPQKSAPAQAKITAIYPYHDEEGCLLYEVCRYEPKTFKQRRPDGNGSYIWNLDNTRRVLYSLPIIVDTEDTVPILIVEGEKDAENLSELGFKATTSMGGASAWAKQVEQWQIDLPLHNRPLIIIPDNDDPGQKHAQQIAESLDGKAKSIKIVQLPGLQDKEDVSDYINRFKDSSECIESLLDIFSKTPFYQKKAKNIAEAIIESRDLKDIPARPREYLLYPWLLERSVNLIFGWRGAGKTWFGMSIANAVAKKLNFGPWKSNHADQAVNVLYVDGEMDFSVLKERANLLGGPLSEDSLSNLYWLSDSYAQEQHDLGKSSLEDPAWRELMEHFLLEKKIHLWVADNLTSLTPNVDENSKKEWDNINQWLLKLRFKGIATVLIHHEGKDGDQRGTSAREDNIDISIHLLKPAGHEVADGCRFLLRFSKARPRVDEGKYFEDIDFKLAYDQLGNKVDWIWNSARKNKRVTIMKMLDQAESEPDIADRLGISRQAVNKVKRELVKEGYMSESGKITQTGYAYLNKITEEGEA